MVKYQAILKLSGIPWRKGKRKKNLSSKQGRGKASIDFNGTEPVQPRSPKAMGFIKFWWMFAFIKILVLEDSGAPVLLLDLQGSIASLCIFSWHICLRIWEAKLPFSQPVCYHVSCAVQVFLGLPAKSGSWNDFVENAKMQNFWKAIFNLDWFRDVCCSLAPHCICSSTFEDRKQAVMQTGVSGRGLEVETRGKNLFSKFPHWKDRIMKLCLQLQIILRPAAYPVTAPLASWAPPCLGMSPPRPRSTHKPVSLYFFWVDNKQVSCDSLTCLNSMPGEWPQYRDSLWVLLGT